jgi:hypothetical protein
MESAEQTVEDGKAKAMALVQGIVARDWKFTLEMMAKARHVERQIAAIKLAAVAKAADQAVKSIKAMTSLLEDARIAIASMRHDLESTRRERDHLAKIVSEREDYGSD